MKSITLSTLCIVLLTACSSPTPSPANPTAIIYSTQTFTKTYSPTYTHNPSPTPEGKIGCVGTLSLNIRSGPGPEYEILGGLAPHKCVLVKARNQDASWGWVISENTTGWVYLYYLSIEGDVYELPLFSEFTQTSLSGTQSPHPSLTVHPSPTGYIIFPTPSPKQSILNCKEMIKYVGQSMVCEIPFAYCTFWAGSNWHTFCHDAPYPNHQFTLVIWGKDWSFYNGFCIVVSGIITTYNGVPEIEVTSGSQISYCD